VTRVPIVPGFAFMRVHRRASVVVEVTGIRRAMRVMVYGMSCYGMASK
jgi:hypothetical protein